jgi:hypothetical protein
MVSSPAKDGGRDLDRAGPEDAPKPLTVAPRTESGNPAASAAQRGDIPRRLGAAFT